MFRDIITNALKERKRGERLTDTRDHTGFDKYYGCAAKLGLITEEQEVKVNNAGIRKYNCSDYK